ncbi:MAG TPA: CaiB/BaiF CoA-transferase family protein [Alphaproteobacteria bacterium]|jgi:alpha-methylacyl-CoA racemase|nr:CaiB/BaiF CoA-transferase family protein [Alphaproteobacteria bacterium]MDP6271093.1 CaiB/BaiF CoA-transferase family protein [Alphaproteobacteria bacterium]MDP7429267.1 CaiB/BaiF CoA-transferase family protein [Alphaproteobacteria bacterium]HJM50012.1 CaiB/BaiF CoA-transferase family protein [Alphaproteobacteria bacterium]
MGPLSGVKVVELAGIGPGPMCAMLLADLGAEVIRIDRLEDSGLGVVRDARNDLLNRGRRSAAVNLKSPEGVETVLKLIESADALVEGFRPGVMERLGLGPEDCFKRNPKLVFGRITGWGQTGPLALAAGHDMNYIALTGALHSIGSRGGPPVPPLNLVGDFGGGALYIAFGIVCGIVEAAKSGQGQVVDAAMTDGASSLMTAIYGLKAQGMFGAGRGSNVLDSGAHFYQVYETKDGQYISLAPIERKFYEELLERVGFDKQKFDNQWTADGWPASRDGMQEVFKTKTRDEWCEILEGTDVCFAPVLSLDEAPEHPHNKARETFVEVEGVVQPAPAPRFSRTPGKIHRPPPVAGEHTDEVLAEWGFAADELGRLREAGAIG